MESVKWVDGEAGSISSDGDTTLAVEEWPRGSGRWVAAVWTGGVRHPICRYMTVLGSAGEESREAAKAAAEAGLRRWLEGGGR